MTKKDEQNSVPHGETQTLGAELQRLPLYIECN